MKEIVFTTLSIQELKEVFANILDEKLKSLVTGKALHSVNEPGLLTRLEVCKLLHITYPTLSNLIKTNQLPAYRVNRRILFKKEDIENFLLKSINVNKFNRKDTKK